MAYDEHTADRIHGILSKKKQNFETKRMFGGLCFMVNDKMCIGVHQDRIMARVGPDLEERALALEGAKQMDFTGRPMRGFIFVDSEGYDMESQLETWVDLCLEYNPIAKASKKKKKLMML